MKSFHNRALRYMTGCHIWKEEGGWEYPSHDALELKCKLFSVETYIKRRRGTMWKYFNEFRRGLLEETERIKAPPRSVNKVLWWKQPYITKKEMQELQNFWYR